MTLMSAQIHFVVSVTVQGYWLENMVSTEEIPPKMARSKLLRKQRSSLPPADLGRVI